MKMPVWIWPPRTGKTFLDVWSIAHFAAGVLIGFDIGSFNVTFIPFFVATLVLGYLWEIVETGIEHFAPRAIKHPEGLLNRWVSDPLMVLLGALLGYWIVSYQ